MVTEASEELEEDGRFLELEGLRAMFEDQLQIEGADECAAMSGLHDVRFSLPVAVDDESVVHGEVVATLHCSLPFGYPERAQPVVWVDGVGLHRDAAVDMSRKLQDVCLEHVGEACVYDLYTTLREKLLPTFLSTIKTPTLSTVPAHTSPGPSFAAIQQRLGGLEDGATTVAVVRIDHMNDFAGYSKKLRDWAQRDSASGALFFRFSEKTQRVEDVFLVLLASDAACVSQFLSNLRTQYVDKDVRGNKCKERKSDVLLQGSARDLVVFAHRGAPESWPWQRSGTVAHSVDSCTQEHVGLSVFEYTDDASLLRETLNMFGLDERGQSKGLRKGVSAYARACTKGGSLLSVTVKPNAKGTPQITNLSELRSGQADSLHVSIAAAPKDGEANKELCSLLSSVFGLAKSSISVARGGCSREKELYLGTISADEIINKIALL
eukprot:TRINITY_DN55646_c0_g1_i1.p1 TRINITY_DN55646_c0_g1~~TRINITY_DN55646_c0_g1_i1.p1  ORF type:complete len:437 (+),score=75.24 TRINITY_DN55646_c0_g1_i1:82-1392(+)